MKGSLNEGVTIQGPRSISNTLHSQDYLVTTMQLRKMALSGKPQNKRVIKYKKSAPPFQNRTLENFPMPHGQADSIRSAKSQRTERCDTAHRMSRARIDSGSLRDYSKQMFNFSVHCANTGVSYSPASRGKENGRTLYRSKSEVQCHSKPIVNGFTSRTNGPTPDGSILHNRKQRVLNDIRIRPHPDYENSTSRRRERTYSGHSLQDAINEKTRNYRVQSVSGESRPDSIIGNVSTAGSDFIFIPLSQHNETNTSFSRHLDDLRRAMCDNTLSEYTDTDSVAMHDPFEDHDEGSLSIGGDFKPLRQSTRPNSSVQPQVLLPPTTSCSLRLVSLDEETSSESDQEVDESPVEVKKPEPPPPAQPQKPGTKEKVVEFEDEKGKHIPEPEPEPEPVKVKLILKGPHCWVDDATITSDQSECEDGPINDVTTAVDEAPQPKDIIQEKQQIPQKVDNKTNKTKSNMKNVVEANKQAKLPVNAQTDNKNAMKEAFEKAVETAQTKTQEINASTVQNGQTEQKINGLIVTDDDETQSLEEVTLPTFICPSSEKKSREAALKHWLATTCFQSGYKEIPIL